jgi:hypothetical protein
LFPAQLGIAHGFRFLQEVAPAWGADSDGGGSIEQWHDGHRDPHEVIWGGVTSFLPASIAQKACALSS